MDVTGYFSMKLVPIYNTVSSWQASCPSEPAGHSGTQIGCKLFPHGYRDRPPCWTEAATVDKEIFTEIMLMTVMQFDVMHSSAKHKEHLQRNNGLFTAVYLDYNAWEGTYRKYSG